MGKVSEADFAEMAGRLRARAVSLIKRLDEGRSYREQIERELARRIGPAANAAARGAAPTTIAGPVTAATTMAVPVAAAEPCAACGTANDRDARFCKQCGASLGPASSLTS